MSQEVNKQNGTAAKIRQSFFEWSSRFEQLDESDRKELAKELSKLVANQLFAMSENKEDLMQVITGLEGLEVKRNLSDIPPDIDKPNTWGPQWKD